MENIKIAKPHLLTESDTINFVHELNSACLLINFYFVKQLISKFNLQNDKDSQVFMDDCKAIFTKFNNYSEQINYTLVRKFDSRCIACSFGKNVSAYEVNYEKNIQGVKILYKGSFAISLTIQNGRLLDFAFCNAFLSEIEVKKL
jgi:hypothetical protein